MKKVSYLYIIGMVIGIISGELLLFLGNIPYALGIYVITLLSIILGITFIIKNLDGTENVLQIFILFILLRLISLSIPQIFTDPILQWLTTFGIMLIPIYYIYNITNSWQTLSKIDFSIYLIIAILIGCIVATYQVFNPLPSDTRYISGEFATICLIIVTMISLSLTGTKYWNEYVSDIIDMCSNSLLPLFTVILMVVIKQTIDSILYIS